MQRSIMGFFCLLAFSFSMFSLISGLVSSQKPPEIPLLPHSFYGEVRIGNNPAPAGTHIFAFIDGSLRGQIETEKEGFYGPFPKLSVEGTSIDRGKIVIFCIEDLLAEQKVLWQPAQVERLDLSTTQRKCPFNPFPTPVSTPTPTVTITATPTATITPSPEAGSGGSGTGATGGAGSGSPGGTPGKTPAQEIKEKVVFEHSMKCLQREDLGGFLTFIKREQRKKSIENLQNSIEIERKLTIKEMTQGTKKWFSVEVNLIVKNISSRKIENLFLIEEVPKELAESSDKIKSKKNFAVIIKDPIIEFYLGSLAAGAENSVQYYAELESETNLENLKVILKDMQPAIAYEVKESKNCDDNEPCTIDEYNEELGTCQYAVLPDGTTCGIDKECKAGKCVVVKETPKETTETTKEPTVPQKEDMDAGQESSLVNILAIVIAFFVVVGIALGIYILIRKHK
ncbi:MAG: hypothetical protein QXM75_04070 [Candidatus Diapherotrites archaeon]